MKNKIKKLYLFCLFLTVIAMSGCSKKGNVAGGAEDVNTFVIAGRVVDSSGNVIDSCKVAIVPESFVPGNFDNSLVNYIYTDSSGMYSFEGDSSGKLFNLIASKGCLSLIRTDIIADTIDILKTDTLKLNGKLRLMVPDNFDSLSDYIFVPGTNFRFDLSELPVKNDNGISIVELSLPVFTYESIFYSSVNGTFNMTSGPLTLVEGSLTDISLKPNWRMFDSLPAALSGSVITALSVDTAGMNLWIGTDAAGLFGIKNGMWEQYVSVDGGIVLDSIKDIRIAGTKLFVLSEGTIISFDGSTFSDICKNNSTVSSMVATGIATSSDGALFASFSGGVGEYSAGKWSVSTTASGHPLMVVTAIDAVDSSVYAVDDFGVMKFDKTSTTWKYLTYGETRAKSISVTYSNEIFVGSSTGLFKLDGGDLKQVASIPSGSYSVISRAADNGLWCSEDGNNVLYNLKKHNAVFTDSDVPLLSGVNSYIAICQVNKYETFFAYNDKIIILNYSSEGE